MADVRSDFGAFKAHSFSITFDSTDPGSTETAIASDPSTCRYLSIPIGPKLDIIVKFAIGLLATKRDHIGGNSETLRLRDDVSGRHFCKSSRPSDVTARFSG